MRLLSLLVAVLASGALAVYVLTCSVDNTPPVPVHPIVGKWQLVRIGNNFSVGTYPNTTEFTKDGKRISESTNLRQGYIRRVGTYVVTGDVMCTAQYGQRDSEDGEHYSVIAVVNAERLVQKTLDNNATNECEYIRVVD